MTPAQLETTNLWLTVIAIASIVQMLLFAIAGAVIYLAYRRATRQIEAFQRLHLQPVVEKLNTVLDETREVLDRVKTADDTVRRVIDRTADTVQRVAWAARSRMWPVLGLFRGVRAAVAQLSGQSQTRLETRTPGPDGRVRS